MTATSVESAGKSLAEVLRALGDVPPERIRVPLGAATEQDVLDALEGGNKRIYELVDGVMVEKDMGLFESMVAFKIGLHLGTFLEKHDLGIVFGVDGPTRVQVGRIRFPDVAFVLWERFPNEEVPEDPILDVAPDLAVEVISKGNTPKEMELKLKDYFKAGVRLVWYIYPKTRTAVVYTSPTAKKEIAKDEALDGGKILPGLSLPLKELFTKARRRLNGRRAR